MSIPYAEYDFKSDVDSTAKGILIPAKIEQNLLANTSFLTLNTEFTLLKQLLKIFTCLFTLLGTR